MSTPRQLVGENVQRATQGLPLVHCLFCGSDQVAGRYGWYHCLGCDGKWVETSPELLPFPLFRGEVED